MRVLKVLFAFLGLVAAGSQAAVVSGVAEQAVIVRFDYGNKDWGQFFTLEKTLERVIEKSGLGDYDGNELAVDGSDGIMYMYGPSADRLFALVKPQLESAKFLKNVRIKLRYGLAADPNAREVNVRIGS